MLPAYLDAAARPLFVHAHPDDETISTGALLAELVQRGKRPIVLTMTRGERGEVRPGVDRGTHVLDALRAAEWTAACATLGVTRHFFAERADGGRFEDSGMIWSDAAQTIAAPDPDASERALARADVAEAAASVVALARREGADAIVGYDRWGGYLHPDHVAAHEAARAAAAELGVPFVEIVSDARGVIPASDADELDLDDHRATVARALAHYASQLEVDADGTHLTHVGGQREEIRTRMGVRISSAFRGDAAQA